MNRNNSFYISLLLCFVVAFSFTGCFFNAKQEIFSKQQVILLNLLDENMLDINGTLVQFNVHENSIPEVSAFLNTKFLTTFEYPSLNSLFEFSSVTITGTVPRSEKTDTPNAIESNEYYRGYIDTNTTHYEGVFLINEVSKEAIFSICTSFSL